VFTLWAGLAVFLSCPLVCRLYHGILNLLVFDRKFPRIITLIFLHAGNSIAKASCFAADNLLMAGWMIMTRCL
jgi:hypothetical protein